VIPDQDVKFGVITVQVIEGSLTRIDVEGNDWFRAGYLRDRIERGAQTPLRLEPLQERLQLLQLDPRIQQVNAELRPGEKRGDSILQLKVKEASPWKAWLTSITTRLWSERSEDSLPLPTRTSPVMATVQLHLRSRGVNPIVDILSDPLNRYDTTFSAPTVETIFRGGKRISPLDLNSNGIIGFTLRQPIYRTILTSLPSRSPANICPTKSPFDNRLAVALYSRLIEHRQHRERVTLHSGTHRTSTSVIAARSRFPSDWTLRTPP
jgi:hypothetical protein